MSGGTTLVKQGRWSGRSKERRVKEWNDPQGNRPKGTQTPVREGPRTLAETSTNKSPFECHTDGPGLRCPCPPWNRYGPTKLKPPRNKSEKGRRPDRTPSVRSYTLGLGSPRKRRKTDTKNTEKEVARTKTKGSERRRENSQCPLTPLQKGTLSLR